MPSSSQGGPGGFLYPVEATPVGERELRFLDRSEGGDYLHANILKLATLFTIYSSTSLFKRRPSTLAGDLDAPSVQRLRNNTLVNTVIFRSIIGRYFRTRIAECTVSRRNPVAWYSAWCLGRCSSECIGLAVGCLRATPQHACCECKA